MLNNLNELVQPIAKQIQEFNHYDYELPEAFKDSVKMINSYKIEYNRFNSCATNPSGQRIFISNSWF